MVQEIHMKRILIPSDNLNFFSVVTNSIDQFACLTYNGNFLVEKDAKHRESVMIKSNPICPALCIMHHSHAYTFYSLGFVCFALLGLLHNTCLLLRCCCRTVLLLSCSLTKPFLVFNFFNLIFHTMTVSLKNRKIRGI